MQLSPQGFSLTYNTINSRYMTLQKRFIAVFSTLVANTTVIGKAADVAFKTTG
jgi:hypothetical protein